MILNKEVTFKKADARKKIATGIVYRPLTLDSQGDFMEASEIEKAAFSFMAKGATRNVDVNHSGVASGSTVVESFISDGSDGLPKDSWAVSVHVPDAALWGDIESGKLTGFSLAGQGTRRPAYLGKSKANLIENLNVDAISLVGAAANRARFSMLKSDTQDMVTQISATLAQLTAVVDSLSTRVDAATTPRSPQNLTKARAEIVAKDSADLSRQMQRRDALQGRLESLWERPETASYVRKETELREAIDSCEMEISILKGASPSLASDPTRSAFFARGGTSNFLVSGPSADGTLHTHGGDSAQIRKAEDQINVTNNMTLGIVK